MLALEPAVQPGLLDREPLKRHEASVNNEFTLFTDTANPALARTIARELGTQIGACVVDRYPDGDLAAGARPEIVVEATHGLFVLDAYTKN